MIKMVQDPSNIVKVVYWVSKARDVYNNRRGILTSYDKKIMLLATGLR